MPSLTTLLNYTQSNYTQTTTTRTISFISGKMYSGYILNQQPNQMTITIILIDEKNKLNQLDPIQLNLWERLSFKNLTLYQIIITLSGTPNTYSYNILGKDYLKDAIPDINLESYNFKDAFGALYVNTGFNPSSWNGNPISEDITVGTTATQIDTLTNETVYEVIIKADSANSGIVKVGDWTGPSYPLAAGQEVHIHYVNPTAIYAISTTAGQILHILYVW
ncbi:MAG: hypothetical protein QXF15_03620 [Candidatus Aenigmatarchaeota archaeon]